MTILYFILLIGVLIFVHELGHFLFAKLFNVKVLKFSLGFGPRMLGFRKGETDRAIADLTQAISFDARNAGLYVSLGYAHLASRNAQAAIKAAR